MNRFFGVFAPIPTPFNDDGEIYFEKLKDNLDKWSRTKLSGVVVLGSNGEFVMLSFDEKLKMVEFVCKNFPEDKLVIAGTGCESARETILLTNKAAEFGIDAALVITPNYYKRSLSESALERYYCSVADASNVPIILYNMPANTGINMSSDLVIRLSKHPNIIGIKDSSGNIVQISEVIKGSSENFAVFAGSGSFLLPTILMGGVGGTMAVANVVPDYCVEIMEAFHSGDIQKARKMQLDLLPLNAAVTSRFGIPGLKAALDMIGFYGGDVRLPLLPLKAGARLEIRNILIDLGMEVL